MMLPCRIFGGVALWATIRCLMPIGFGLLRELTTAFALSVLAGMISFLPIGLGVRDVVQALFLLPLIAAAIPGPDAFAEAKLIVTLVVLLQRVFQIGVEAVPGVLGGWITTGK
jgi:uncharacterized membrane protein YbhN (UPF0104 family)